MTEIKVGDKVRYDSKHVFPWDGIEGCVTRIAGSESFIHVTKGYTRSNILIGEEEGFSTRFLTKIEEPVSQYKVGDLVTFVGKGNDHWDGGKGKVISIDTKPNKYPVRVEVLVGPPKNDYYTTGAGKCGWFSDPWLEPWVEESKSTVAPHYAAGMPEGIDALAIMKEQGWEKNFLLGGILKYITRCEHKGQYLSDLKKIQDYAGKLIALEEAK